MKKKKSVKPGSRQKEYEHDKKIQFTDFYSKKYISILLQKYYSSTYKANAIREFILDKQLLNNSNKCYKFVQGV